MPTNEPNQRLGRVPLRTRILGRLWIWCIEVGILQVVRLSNRNLVKVNMQKGLRQMKKSRNIHVGLCSNVNTAVSDNIIDLSCNEILYIVRMIRPRFKEWFNWSATYAILLMENSDR